MEKSGSKSFLGIAIALGALWGLSEAGLGMGLRSCAAFVSGALMTGVALFFMAAGWVLTRKILGIAVMIGMCGAVQDVRCASPLPAPEPWSDRESDLCLCYGGLGLPADRSYSETQPIEKNSRPGLGRRHGSSVSRQPVPPGPVRNRSPGLCDGRNRLSPFALLYSHRRRRVLGHGSRRILVRSPHSGLGRTVIHQPVPEGPKQHPRSSQLSPLPGDYRIDPTDLIPGKQAGQFIGGMRGKFA